MSKNKNQRVFKISYLPVQEDKIIQQMLYDNAEFIKLVKLVCSQNNLHIWNLEEFKVAVELLKMQSTYN